MSYESFLLALSLLTLIVATIGATYSFRSDRRKSGTKIRGFCSIMSTVEAEDQYAKYLTLHNLKDRSVVIFGIYLKVGHGQYLEIADLSKDPLVLEPFGVYHKEYDPVDLYTSGFDRVRLDGVLTGLSYKSRIVLSTADGKYSVRKSIGDWSPIGDFFDNHYTDIFHPLRSSHAGRVFGSNTLYVVKLTTSSGKEEAIPIFPDDHERSKFKNFDLTRDCLGSPAALQEFLQERMYSGDLPYFHVTVFDLRSWRRELYRRENNAVRQPTVQGWFPYHIVGPVVTRWRNVVLKLENRRRHKQRRSPTIPS